MNLPHQSRPVNLSAQQHPLPHGYIFTSPGGHFSYRVVGACCRLFDRETLPYPCCRIEWHGKEPSWRRIGRRFTVDLATRNSPSYSVEIVGQSSDSLVMTLYPVKLPQPLKEWWVSSKPSTVEMTDLTSPESADAIKIDG
ncbi:hypothetical protein ACKFKG_06935 [Phormidesmis sp. 146-35]